jgi:phosphatidylserine/phosphatidylglycerophosphate/cardiolipin synthase-like enzyme
MDEQRQAIITGATRLAAELPLPTVYALAQTLERADGVASFDAMRAEALQAAPQPAQRARIIAFLDAWLDRAPDIQAGAVALALRTAAAATRSVREAQRVELVWTGPLAVGVPMRRTDQALLQVINSAHHELLVVSFAVYNIPTVAEALVRAATRGVVIRICVEAPEPSGQRMAYDTIRALGTAVAAATSIYIWPANRRPTDAHGRAGVLHTKCAVADRRLLFLSSANLTEYALNLNMELGALIYGGAEPETVAAQFERMIAEGTLQKAQ